MTIVWIDGTYGVGKTAVANALCKQLKNAYVLDMDELREKYPPKSFQDICGELYPAGQKYIVNGLRSEIDELIERGGISYIIVPFTLITSYCTEKLLSITCNSVHIVLTAEEETLRHRIMNQKGRDVDFALAYMQKARDFLATNYPDAIRIDTTLLDADTAASIIKKSLLSADSENKT